MKTSETKFRRALKQAIEDHRDKLDELILGLVEESIYSQSATSICGFCREYLCEDCPVRQLCRKHLRVHNAIQFNIDALTQLEITVLMYLHWLWDNNITEKQCKEVNNEME